MDTAVKWYENQMISQGRAAEIAGISRAEFIDSLDRFGVTTFQVDAEELIREATNGCETDTWAVNALPLIFMKKAI